MITDPAEQKAAFDEIAKAKHVSQNYRTLMGLYDQAERENTALGRVGRLGYEPPSVKGLRALIDPLIHDQEGRINEQVLNHINAILPGPFERAGTQATNKAAFENFLQSQLQGQTFQGNTMVPLSRFKATAIPVINPMEGKTASNDQGQRIIMQNGRWVPYNGR
jgi:hypothetical protein